jgi:predicted RNA binding protein YcfA (HicA-like mRNA interferase family)
MSSKMPVISGEHLIQVLTKFGYQVVRQKGSHVRLRHSTDTQRQAVAVLLHKEIAFGTLRPDRALLCARKAESGQQLRIASTGCVALTVLAGKHVNPWPATCLESRVERRSSDDR